VPSEREEARDARAVGFQVVAALVVVMWAVEIVDSIDDHALDRHGIQPRDGDGLIGIVTAPFLHASFGHLMANTIPFAVMGFAIAFKGAARVLAVTAIVALVGGLGTWLVAPENSVHIGASGVVFGYATYLLSRGFFDRDFFELLIGVGVAFVWGSALLGGLLPRDGISWQGHLFGAVGGLVAARLLAPAREPREERGSLRA
jgi:membrane associated rhomboid family serine protease